MKIFVSYSRRDAGDFANQIPKHLSSFKHDIFIDVDSIKVGEIWSNSIEENISKCDIFVIIVTRGALISPHVEREVLQADSEDKIIIPCKHEYVEDSTIKWGLQKIQGIQFLDKFDLVRELEFRITNSILNKFKNIPTIREEGTKDTNSVLNTFKNIPTIREEGTKDTNSVLKILEDIQKNTMYNFNKIRSDIVKFDLNIPADRLLFYLHLLEYLTNSNEVFLNQNRIQYLLADSLRKKDYHILRNIGYDEHFYNVHSKMNDEEREMFNFLRRTTEDSKLLNTFAKRLLQDNLEIFTEMPELKLLYEHYCYWLGKYELLKNDPDMCLVYVGPKQKKRFPIGIESRINEKIKALRKETLLQDLP